MKLTWKGDMTGPDYITTQMIRVFSFPSEVHLSVGPSTLSTLTGERPLDSFF